MSTSTQEREHLTENIIPPTKTSPPPIVEQLTATIKDWNIKITTDNNTSPFYSPKKIKGRTKPKPWY